MHENFIEPCDNLSGFILYNMWKENLVAKPLGKKGQKTDSNLHFEIVFWYFWGVFPAFAGFCLKLESVNEVLHCEQ